MSSSSAQPGASSQPGSVTAQTSQQTPTIRSGVTIFNPKLHTKIMFKTYINRWNFTDALICTITNPNLYSKYQEVLEEEKKVSSGKSWLKIVWDRVLQIAISSQNINLAKNIYKEHKDEIYAYDYAYVAAVFEANNRMIKLFTEKGGKNVNLGYKISSYYNSEYYMNYFSDKNANAYEWALEASAEQGNGRILDTLIDSGYAYNFTRPTEKAIEYGKENIIQVLAGFHAIAPKNSYFLAGKCAQTDIMKSCIGKIPLMKVDPDYIGNLSRGMIIGMAKLDIIDFMNKFSKIPITDARDYFFAAGYDLKQEEKNVMKDGTTFAIAARCKNYKAAEQCNIASFDTVREIVCENDDIVLLKYLMYKRGRNNINARRFYEYALGYGSCVSVLEFLRVNYSFDCKTSVESLKGSIASSNNSFVEKNMHLFKEGSSSDILEEILRYDNASAFMMMVKFSLETNEIPNPVIAVLRDVNSIPDSILRVLINSDFINIDYLNRFSENKRWKFLYYMCIEGKLGMQESYQELTGKDIQEIGYLFWNLIYNHLNW